jgi:hypothetical protein
MKDMIEYLKPENCKAWINCQLYKDKKCDMKKDIFPDDCPLRKLKINEVAYES